MVNAAKCIVTLDKIPLAATAGITWKFQSGSQPYQTIFTVAQKHWDEYLKQQKGKPLTLEIQDTRGTKLTIKQVYILYEVPSDSPNRASFLVSDKRWKWQYQLIVRDFNVPRKTGQLAQSGFPTPAQSINFDIWSFYQYSLKDQKSRWKAREALHDVLQELHDGDSAGFQIGSWFVNQEAEENGTVTLQNVLLRDAGDVAVGKLLNFIPGTDIYIDANGITQVYNAGDMDSAETYFGNLPLVQWGSDAPVMVDRATIRPSKIVLHYDKEIEILLLYRDDYSSGGEYFEDSWLYMNNVCQTVDPLTTIDIYDDATGTWIEGAQVPAGTWVRFDKWLKAMDEIRPENSEPWTFDTISKFWMVGDLETMLGAGSTEYDDKGNVAARVQAIRQHFRQTFRISPKIMTRVREMVATRVTVLDPVTGLRAPAAAWPQACFIPSKKGSNLTALGRNVDYYEASKGTTGANFGRMHRAGFSGTAPCTVNMVDAELGIIRLEWLPNSKGLVAEVIPCHLVQEDSTEPIVLTRDLREQDDKPILGDSKTESGANGLQLSDTCNLYVMLSFVPAGNFQGQLHVKEVSVGDLDLVFTEGSRIQSGTGPELHMYVEPGEMTSRWSWLEDSAARSTVKDMLGLIGTDQPGLSDPTQMPGYRMHNENELDTHAQSYAAELIVNFADSWQGSVASVIPSNGQIALKGNMGASTIRIASAPSGKVDLVSDFAGQQRPLSRFAAMSTTMRAMILGYVPFGQAP